MIFEQFKHILYNNDDIRYSTGSTCLFFKINDKVGVKIYTDYKTFNTVYNSQLKINELLEHYPKAYSDFKLEVSLNYIKTERIKFWLKEHHERFAYQ